MSDIQYTFVLEEILNSLKEINKFPKDINEFNTYNILGYLLYKDLVNNIKTLSVKYIRCNSFNDPDGWISFKDGSWLEREYGELIS